MLIMEDSAEDEGLPSWFTNMPEQILQIHHFWLDVVALVQLAFLGDFSVGVDNWDGVGSVGSRGPFNLCCG